MKKINTFWNWFQDNNQTIKNCGNETPENQKQILYWLDKNLKYYGKEIGFMIVLPDNPNEKAEFIITANGNPDNFRKVIDLVDSAPKLRTWKFSAFVKPSEEINELMEGLDEPYVVREIGLKAKELKFLPLEYNVEIQKLDIIIYLNNHKIHCDTKTWYQALLIIIQNLFKEKYLYQHINFVQLAQMPQNQQDVIYLYELQFYIDEINNCNK